MTKTNKMILGVSALIGSLGYVIMPYDVDCVWYGYIDDFFVFMSGYSFFMAQRSKSKRAETLLKLFSCGFLMVGMLSLIALIIFIA